VLEKSKVVTAKFCRGRKLPRFQRSAHLNLPTYSNSINHLSIAPRLPTTTAGASISPVVQDAVQRQLTRTDVFSNSLPSTVASTRVDQLPA
jgi:hypothetical protein